MKSEKLSSSGLKSRRALDRMKNTIISILQDIFFSLENANKLNLATIVYILKET